MIVVMWSLPKSVYDHVCVTGHVVVIIIIVMVFIIIFMW